MSQNALQGWSREQGHFFFFFFASGTQLLHLTFSVCPLPRGEIARVSKGGCHTSWILLSFNFHSLFSPWWCTIRNENIAQLRGFLKLLLRYYSLFLCHAKVLTYEGYRYWVHHICTMLCHRHSPDEKQLHNWTRSAAIAVFKIWSLSVFHCRVVNNFYACIKVLFVYFNLIRHS